MKGYSIFSETIVDMTWLEVEDAARSKAIMLVPIGVIEQHGPHLPLGTDIYAATLMCSLIKSDLDRRGIKSVIAPPYYFGMNQSTGMFPGSISIRSESMISVLSDLLVNYGLHGFKRQFLLNHHGDFGHNRSIVEAVRSATEQGVNATLIVGGLLRFAIERALTSADPPLPPEAILKIEDSDQTRKARERLNRSAMHIHAEERETSLVMKWFPKLLKKEKEIRNLKPVAPSMQVFSDAAARGKWRELSPLGYIGDPSVATIENAQLYVHESRDAAEAIAKILEREK